MKLSSDTVAILKNFASVNSNIVIKPGSVLKTVSDAKNIMAVATISESFNNTMGIYDLNEFLSSLSMFDDPTLDFDDDGNFVTIKEGRRSIKYFFSSPEMLTSPSKDITMPIIDVELDMPASIISNVKKAASLMNTTDLSIAKIDNDIVLSVSDVKNNTSNSYTEVLVEGTDIEDNFNFIFSIDNLKFVQDDYKLSISSKLISKFDAVNHDVVYYVALEKSSTFGV